jgi:hypothetical protein
VRQSRTNRARATVFFPNLTYKLGGFSQKLAMTICIAQSFYHRARAMSPKFGVECGRVLLIEVLRKVICVVPRDVVLFYRLREMPEANY